MVQSLAAKVQSRTAQLEELNASAKQLKEDCTEEGADQVDARLAGGFSCLVCLECHYSRTGRDGWMDGQKSYVYVCMYVCMWMNTYAH